MNIIRKIVAGLAGVVVIALALQLAAPKAVHAVVSTLVTVTNTPNVSVVNVPAVTVANTVPVTGTVSVSSMPPVQLSGSVNVANPTDISGHPVPLITDTSAVVHSGSNSATSCSFAGTNTCSATLATAPSNASLVPQSFSGFCNLNASGNQMTHIYIDTIAPVGMVVPGPLISEGGFATQNFQESLTGISVSPSGTIGVQIYLQNSDTGDCQFFLSSYTAQ